MDRTAPAFHRDAERQAIDHLQQLLRDASLTVPTSRGPMALDALQRRVVESNDAVEIKRQLAAAGRPSFELQQAMPLGRRLEVSLEKLSFLGLWRKSVGQITVRTLSPIDSLIAERSPAPVSHVLSPQGSSMDVLVCTTGLTPAARAAVGERQILLEPNDAGGWTVTAGAAFAGGVEAFNPESPQHRQERVRAAVERSRLDLSAGGVNAARIAEMTQLPPGEVAACMKRLAAADASLRHTTIDGQAVLLPGDASAKQDSMIERMKNLFGRADPARQVAALQEQRAALSQQADRLSQEVGELDDRQLELRGKFAAADESMRRRITQQVLSLRKDAERRQQLLGVIRQQENIVSTHLHHLELKRQGTVAKLPNADRLAEDASAAEEVLAELQASSDLADSMSASTGGLGLSDAEAALYDELALESSTNSQAASAKDRTAATPAKGVEPPAREAQRPPPSAEPG